MHPWLCNVQLVDIAATRLFHKDLQKREDDFIDEVPLPHVEMSGDGWGSTKATQLVLNNLFYLTVKVRCDNNNVIRHFIGTCIRSEW